MEDQDEDQDLEIELERNGLALNSVFFIMFIIILGINLLVGK